MSKGIFIEGITVEMLRNASLEAVEDLMNCGDMVDLEVNQTEWIPVSERLPKTGDSILVTYSDGEVGIVWDARPEVWGTYIKSNNLIYPIAWMPLPEPYREEKQNG